MSTRRNANAKANAAEKSINEVNVNEINDFAKKVDNILNGLGLEEESARKQRAVISSLQKNDIFTLSNLSVAKLDLNIDNFIPLVFNTDKGAMIGVKHFANVSNDVDDQLPPLGNTAEEVANFFVYCKEHKIHFQVIKKTPIVVEATATHPEYTKNVYMLAVVDY